MPKYVSGDFFLTYELFKFYAWHDMWDEADKYLAAMKEQKNLPPVFPTRKYRVQWVNSIGLIDTCHSSYESCQSVEAG